MTSIALSLPLAVCMLMACIVCDNNVTTFTLSPETTAKSSQSTIASTTPATTTTTSVAPSLENSTKPAHNSRPSNRTRHLNTTSYVCSCDLTFNCDVNCCCDLDCSDEIVKAFDCASDLDIDDFYHGEGLERCAVDSSLLCIAHDNVPSIDFNIHVPYHVEYSTYEWPKNVLASRDALEPHRETLSSHDFYQYGDAILAYDMRSEKFETIQVPAYTIGDNSRCFLSEPVKFLKSKSIKCSRSISELCSYNNRLMLQLLNAKYRPRETTAAADVFAIVIESCRRTHDNCTQISYDGSDIGAEALELLLGDDVYEDIHLAFVTNDTRIVSATVKFGCSTELSCNGDDFEPSPKITQSIRVDFVNANENRDERRVRAKSRGYANAEPIVASRYRPLNETAIASEMAFDYFRNDTVSLVGRDFHMALPRSSKRGTCIDQFDGIRFNENSRTSCRVELARETAAGAGNFTACQQAQHQLIHFLFNALNLTANYTRDGYLADVYVSKFWSPRYSVDSWTRVSVHNMPLWSPEMQESEKMLTCSHIITAANYKFLYSTVKTSGTKKYEHFIDAVLIEFRHTDELQLPLADDDNGTTHVDIQINVQFVNLHQKTAKNHASVMRLSSVVILLIGAHLHL